MLLRPPQPTTPTTLRAHCAGERRFAVPPAGRAPGPSVGRIRARAGLIPPALPSTWALSLGCRALRVRRSESLESHCSALLQTRPGGRNCGGCLCWSGRAFRGAGRRLRGWYWTPPLPPSETRQPPRRHAGPSATAEREGAGRRVRGRSWAPPVAPPHKHRPLTTRHGELPSGATTTAAPQPEEKEHQAACSRYR